MLTLTLSRRTADMSVGARVRCSGSIADTKTALQACIIDQPLRVRKYSPSDSCNTMYCNATRHRSNHSRRHVREAWRTGTLIQQLGNQVITRRQRGVGTAAEREGGVLEGDGASPRVGQRRRTGRDGYSREDRSSWIRWACLLA